MIGKTVFPTKEISMKESIKKLGKFTIFCPAQLLEIIMTFASLLTSTSWLISLRSFKMYVGQSLCLFLFFFSAHSNSWKAMLSKTKVGKYFLPNINMLSFCQNAFRGGMKGVGGLRTLKANNKYKQSFNANAKVNLWGFSWCNIPVCWYHGANASTGWISLENWLHSERHSIRRPSGDIGFILKWTWIILPLCIHLTMICHTYRSNFINNQHWLSSYALLFGLKTSCTASLVEALFHKTNYTSIFTVLCSTIFTSLSSSLRAAVQAEQLSKKIYLKNHFNKKVKDFGLPKKNIYKLMSNARFCETGEF